MPVGPSSNPIVIFGPDPPPVRAPNSTYGVSAPAGYQSAPPPIDPVVQAIQRIGSDKHGMK